MFCRMGTVGHNAGRQAGVRVPGLAPQTPIYDKSIICDVRLKLGALNTCVDHNCVICVLQIQCWWEPSYGPVVPKDAVDGPVCRPVWGLPAPHCLCTVGPKFPSSLWSLVHSAGVTFNIVFCDCWVSLCVLYVCGAIALIGDSAAKGYVPVV